MLLFEVTGLLFLKNGQMCPKNSFSRFSQKILIFLKNCSIKKYSASVIKKVIFIFGVR